jgi:endogenous inhibitor of DNA gyrase (YacG/DUF329 family)
MDVVIAPVKCPNCGQAQPGLKVNAGRLINDHGVFIIGYMCRHCKKVVHWGARGAQKDVEHDRA